MTPQIAWIGLGNMGRGMCKNLVGKGNLSQSLIIFNRTKQRADDLASELGAGKTKVASTINEAVEASDIIFTCVARDPDVKETIQTCLKSNVKGKLFVDCSTIHPDTTRELSKTITDQGAYFVASPVFGAAAMAESGQLVFVVAGPKAHVDTIKPFTKGVMGRAVIDFSDQDPGKATLLKLIGNSFVLNMVEILSEGHAVAEKSGLGSDNLHAFIEAMFPGPYTAYSNRLRSGDYYKREEPLFAVDLALKDAGHALALADHFGAKMNALKVVEDHLKDVKKRSGEKGDIAGIYGAVREESGLPFEN